MRCRIGFWTYQYMERNEFNIAQHSPDASCRLSTGGGDSSLCESITKIMHDSFLIKFLWKTTRCSQCVRSLKYNLPLLPSPRLIPSDSRPMHVNSSGKTKRVGTTVANAPAGCQLQATGDGTVTLLGATFELPRSWQLQLLLQLPHLFLQLPVCSEETCIAVPETLGCRLFHRLVLVWNCLSHHSHHPPHPTPTYPHPRFTTNGIGTGGLSAYWVTLRAQEVSRIIGLRGRTSTVCCWAHMFKTRMLLKGLTLIINQQSLITDH